MSAGFAFGAACYPSSAIAAAKACSSTHGVTASGVVTCVGFEVEDGAYTGALALATTPAEGAPLSNTLALSLQPCERFDYLYYAPVYGLTLGALVAFACAAMLRRIFSRETA